MAVMAPVAGFSLTAFERFSAGLPLPGAATAHDEQLPLPDVVVFSSAPMRILSDLASAGLRQLTALLPMIEQAVQGESTAPLGYLAKAASAAARQINDGHQALLAEGPDRVATSMQRQAPAQSDAPANAATETKQLLRTLARQIGAEPAEDSPTSEPLRTIVRQSGGNLDTLPAEHPDRVATSMERQASAQSRAPASEAATDTKQLLRTLARRIGAQTGSFDENSTSEPFGTIARQAGAADQLEPRFKAEPGAGPIERWISEAKHLLRSTGDVLERADERLRPLAAEPTNVAGGPTTAWVLTEILAAQAQIAVAYNALTQSRATARVSYRAASRAVSLDSLAGATTLLGMLLILTTLWIIGGLWSAVTGVVALCGTAVWVWRISQASRGVTLDARR